MVDTPRFRKIDEQNRPDHHYLSADDECYFLYEYTSRQGYAYSATNSLVSNLKKKPSQRFAKGYRYKGLAIDQCAREFGAAINPRWLASATLVPVPPSKAHEHPDYDDRILQACRKIPALAALDVRELVVQTDSLDAAHESDNRPTVESLLAVYRINETLVTPPPQRIGIVDDVLTVGTHFVAMKRILSLRFPSVPIVGFFIARRVIASPFAGLPL